MTSDAETPRPRHLGWLASAAVFAAAVLAQAWILELPFQYDDYALLKDPWSLFARVPEAAGDVRDVEPFMLRWTLWLYWGIAWWLAGEPLDPLPFHLGALLLHGCVSVLLARLVLRLAPDAVAKRAGLLAGLAFGLAAGGIQAVSWSAAQSDLLFPLFGLLGLHAFLTAADRSGREAARARWIGAAWTWVALVSKAPAMVIPPVAVLLLLAARRAPARNAVALAVAVGAAFLTRFLYLGSFRLRYQQHAVPSLDELPALLGRAVAALGQAVYPWNRHEVFEGDGPFAAEALLGGLDLSTPALAGLLFLPWIALALWRAPSTRGPIAVGAAACLVLALPSALLYQGKPTNVIGRTCYLPLLAAWATGAIACAGLLASRGGRVLGGAALLWLALHLLDARAHVARTERAAADHQEHTRSVLEAAREQHAARSPGRELCALVVTPGAGLGGVPMLGHRLADATAPPFAHASGMEVLVFFSEDEILERWPDLDIGGLDVQLFGPRGPADEPALGETAGARHRAELRLAARSPVRAGLPDAARTALAWTSEPRPEGTAWVPSTPLPAHALVGLRLSVAPGPAGPAVLALRTAASTVEVPLALSETSEPCHLDVEPWTRPDQLLALPVQTAEWRSTRSFDSPPELLTRLPTVTVVSPLSDATLSLDPDAPPPAFRLELPPHWVGPAVARLELRLLLPAAPLPIFADVPVLPASGPVPLVPTHLHADGRLRPPVPASQSAPWPVALREALLPRLTAKQRTSGRLDWRVTLYHPTGVAAARSSRTPGRFVAP